ncbi:MAG: fibronectin type III domain-containing protein [Capnocytophaga leadbetteri]
MKRIVNLRKGALLLLLIATTLVVNCSKDNKEPEMPTTQVEVPEHLKDWTPQPKIDVKQPYMVFLSANTASTTLTLTALGSTPTATDVWVDTNNNGLFDKEKDIRITDFTKPVTFNATDKLFTVYGKVKLLNTNLNALTNADVRSNPFITKLDVSQNKMSEEALLALATHLPVHTATATSATIVLRNTKADENVVTDAVLNAVKTKKWIALKKEGDTEVPDVPEPPKPDADKEAPKVGTITEATATAYNSMSVKWSAATDNKTPADKLLYQLIWQAKGNPEIHISEIKPAMLSLSINGLTEKTTYVIKVKVTDEAGNEAIYEAKEVTTPNKPEEKDTVSPTPGKIIEVTPTINTIFLRWSAATDNKTPADKLYYQVIYYAKDEKKEIYSQTKASMFTYTITGLRPKTTYIIKVRVTDEAGNATEYAEVIKNTLEQEAPKPGVITKIEAKHNSIQASWTTASDNKTSTENLLYSLCWRKEGSNYEYSSAKVPNMRSSFISGLKLNTTYIVTVKVYDEDGNVSEYPSKKITTLAAPLESSLNKTTYAVLTTDKKHSIRIYLDAEERDREGVWIDINNNGVYDSGVDAIPESFIDDEGNHYYTLKSSTFRIYGNITELNVWSQELSVVDVSRCRNLKFLGCYNNNLTNGLYLGEAIYSLQILGIGKNPIARIDLSKAVRLKDLSAPDCPKLESLDLKNNRALKTLNLEDSLTETALTNCIKSISSRGGEIYLKKNQMNAEIWSALKEKDWKVK